MLITGLTIGCAIVILLAGIAVVRSSNLVHSVFYLAAVLLGTAGLFLSLHSPFLAAIQVLLYTGGVITLMLFGVMLTQRAEDTEIPNPATSPVRGLVVSGAVLIILLVAIWLDPTVPNLLVKTKGAQPIGEMFLTEQLLAFEALSVLLLAAMIGAIVLARRTDPGE